VSRAREEQRLGNSDSLLKFMSEVNRRIFDLVNSADEREQLCGVEIIGAFLNFRYSEFEKQLEKSGNYLRMLFDQEILPIPILTLRSAALVFGISLLNV